MKPSSSMFYTKIPTVFARHYKRNGTDVCQCGTLCGTFHASGEALLACLP